MYLLGFEKLVTGRPQIRTEAKDYLAKEAEMVAIEPTEEDITRYIEQRLKEDLDKSTIDEGLREDIRNVIPKKVKGMYVLTIDVKFHKLG